MICIFLINGTEDHQQRYDSKPLPVVKEVFGFFLRCHLIPFFGVVAKHCATAVTFAKGRSKAEGMVSYSKREYVFALGTLSRVRGGGVEAHFSWNGKSA
jgi:hypothetical protein